MKTRPWRDIRGDIEADPVRRERLAQHKRAIDDVLALAQLRTHRTLTQQQVADALSVSQARISQIEHQEDIYLSTLREYVAGMGGELRITVVFPDESVELMPRSVQPSTADAERIA